MIFTHHFASLSTLARARRWLETVGFPADRIQTHDDGVPRLVVTAEPAQADMLRLLVDAVERSDPDGWPSFWHEARRGLAGEITASAPHDEVPGESTDEETVPPHRAEVGWHPAPPEPPHPDAVVVRDQWSPWT